jgi:lipopolysaccharide transport system permease protein
MMATLTVAFTLILRVPIPNFPVFYLTAGILWHFFTNSVQSATNSVVGGAALVKTTSLPRYLLPIVTVMSQMINLATEMMLLFGLYFVYPSGFNLNLTLLFYPVLLLTLTVLIIGLGFIAAAANIRFRDTFYIVSSATMIGFWVTPILYDVSMAPPWIANLLTLNPLAGIFEGSRQIIMFGRLPPIHHLVPSFMSAILVFIIGCLVFRKENVTAADYV